MKPTARKCFRNKAKNIDFLILKQGDFKHLSQNLNLIQIMLFKDTPYYCDMIFLHIIYMLSFKIVLLFFF